MDQQKASQTDRYCRREVGSNHNLPYCPAPGRAEALGGNNDPFWIILVVAGSISPVEHGIKISGRDLVIFILPCLGKW